MEKKGVVLGYLVLVVIVVIFYFYFNQSRPLQEKFEPYKVTIEQGEGVSDIAEKLAAGGLIKNKMAFELFAWLGQTRDKFWPGEYYLSPDMSLKEIINALVSQHQAPEETITIIEGWTIKDIAAYLAEQELVSQEDFFAALEEVSAEEPYEFLADRPSGADLEGYLFPDTYRIYQETTARAIVEKLLQNFDQKVDAEMRAKIKEQDRTIFETITLASLVEKEAALEQDRRIIADIFSRRLANDIPLQSCASVNYILGSSTQRLTYEETRTESPYNTYLYRGLPPGPIGNPSLSSIKAVLDPIVTDYWYFLATPEGKTIFSKSLDEHNQNKQEYLE